jgi:hypothetical protein
MTAQAVFLVIRRDLLVRRVGLEERPSPTVTPKWIAWVASLCVLDHHEPNLRSGGPARVPSRHLCVIGSEDLFHQYGSIRVFSSLAVRLSSAGGGVGEVHLRTAAEIDHRICSERFILVPVVAGLSNVSSLVDQIKPLKPGFVWGLAF